MVINLQPHQRKSCFALKKLCYIIFCLFLALNACGRKGPLEHLKDEKRPKFDKVID
jgi:predicted small lipoprotein YifL